MYKINKNIIPSQNDLDVYIGKTFQSNYHGKFKVLGIHSVGRRSTKKYLCQFEDGGITISDGNVIRKGEIKPNYYAEEEVEIDESLEKENAKLRKQLQKSRDDLRILRKDDRSMYRNNEVYSNFIDSLMDYVDNRCDNYTPCRIKPIDENLQKQMILCFGDHHLGQKISLPTNEFNMDVARQRLFKYVNKSLEYAKSMNISNITVLWVGDGLNLDDRLDQLLTNQYTRAESFLRAFDLYCEIVEYLLNKGYEISMAGIVGNESRMKGHEHMSNVDDVAKDNLDYMVYQMLKRKYKNYITFINDCDKLEDMIHVNGHEIIILHGNNIKHSNLDREIKSVKERWFTYSGIWADYAMLGHIHSPLITSDYARSSSLCGENSYSDKKLNISFSSVSQNMFIVGKDIHGIIVDCR
jgi:hypothetical protein